MEAFCDAWFASWTGGDPEALLAYYAEDARYADPAKPDGIEGRAALLVYFGKLLPANPRMVWTRRELMPIDGGFAVTWTARIPVGATEVVERGCDLVWLRGDLIVRNEVFFDLTRWRAALGR